jgi:integrase
MNDMAKNPWLTQRKTTFYLRAPVPKDIQDSFGKKEVTYSLGTKDRREADRKIIAEAKKVSDLFEAHRNKVAQNTSQASQAPAIQGLSPSQITAWTDRHYQQIMDDEFEERHLCWQQVLADPEGFLDNKYIKHPYSDWYLTFFEELSNEERFLCCLNHKHRSRLEAVEQALAKGDLNSHARTAEILLELAQITVSASDKIKLTRKLMEAEVAALEAILKKDRSRYDRISERYAAQSQTTTVTAATAIASDPGPKLETLVDDFLKEGTTGGLVKKTTIGDKTDLREFVTVVGNKAIRSYTAEDGEKFKKVLQSVPAQRKVDPFKTLNIAQAARRAEELDPDRKAIRRLHVDTINDKLGAIRRFFEWANSQKKNVPNPVEGLRIKTSKRAKSSKVKRRYPFTVQQLQTIFNGPVYTGCKSRNYWKQPGSLVLRDSARFWAPLIALYSGMRLGEIIQLRTNDVKTESGVLFFDITTLLVEDDDAEDKSLKNDNSLREIPVHPMLLTLGFAQFVEERRRQGSTRLFPDYDRSPTDDSWSKTFSAWFRHYREHLGVWQVIRGRNKVDFHSFRHTFEDGVRDIPNVNKEWRDALQGHGETGVSGEYGLGVRLQRLFEVLEKLSYPGLDLSHLIRDGKPG